MRWIVYPLTPSFAATRCPRPMRALRSVACALAVAAGCAAAQAPALPIGLTVIDGQASTTVRGNQMVVTNSANAILNWQTFSIGNGQSVRFDQPGAGSQVLNRVAGSDPSRIFGSISSNGGVWLVNPHGVLFGPNARVDVAGLVASTLNISDADWRARRYSLYAGQGSDDAAAVVNQGELRSTGGGRILLIGGRGGVRNEGVVDAPTGHVGMVAGQRIELVDSTLPFIAVRVDVPVGKVLNLGRLSASSGLVDLNAAMVSQQGMVSADGTAGTQGGAVKLTASGDLTLSAGSTTTANGSRSGTVTARGETTLVRGTVAAEGANGTGGQVHLLGRQVGLLGDAVVSASGSGGGGEVLVGGGLQGLDPSVPNARATYLAPGATIRADATQAGDGGRIIVWGNESTRAYAHLSARGGGLGGNGGFIETSGGWLDAMPSSVDVGAPRGRNGNWLLDPNNIVIVDTRAEADVATIPAQPPSTDTTFAPTALNSSLIRAQTISDALQTGNVTITTLGTSGGGQGNIVMQRETNRPRITISTNQGNKLELIAAGTINLQGADIQLLPAPGGASLGLSLNARASVELGNTTISTSGPVEIRGQRFDNKASTSIQGSIVSVNADMMNFNGSSSISATQNIGTTITLRGRSAQTIRNLAVEPGATLQIAPLASWEIFVPSIVPSGSFSLGTIVPDRYAYLAPNMASPLAAGRTVYYSDAPPVVEDSVIQVDPADHRLEKKSLGDPTFSLGTEDEAAPTFGPVDVAGLPPEELSKLLVARDAYKERLLGPTLKLLRENPSIAEVPDCKTFLHATVGDCLIVDAEREALRQYLLLVEKRVVRQLNVGAPIPLIECTDDEQAKSGNCMPLKRHLITLMSRLPVEREPIAGPIPGIKRKYAVVIGIDRYESGIPPLRNAKNDAAQMSALLRKDFDYEVTLVEDGTKLAIFKALNELAARARQADSVLIYFAGHGAIAKTAMERQTGGDGYWLSKDTDPNKPSSFLTNSDIVKILDLTVSNQVILISDSCFSGSFIGSSAEIIKGRPAVVPEIALGKRAVTVMTAGRNEPVADSGSNGNSVYTGTLLKELRAASTWRAGDAVSQNVASSVGEALQGRQVPQYAGLKQAGHQPDAEYFFEVRKIKQ